MRYIAFALLLVGCATLPDDPAANPEASGPLTCIGPAQCDLYWQRAQAWVANSSKYRLSVVTNTLIETSGPLPGRSDLAFRVTRIPRSDGANILIAADCDNAFGCTPRRTDAMVAFKRFVRN